MIVFYRLCGIASTNPSPILQDDKFQLNILCLKSFINAFKEVKPKVIFLCDFCSPMYKEMLNDLVPFEYEAYYYQLGINETCLKQYEMAKEQDDDILFAECDYLWQPNSGNSFVEGLNQLKLVSPYNHLNFYMDRNLHSNQVVLELVGDTHWRSTERNTMTFAVKNDVFKKNYEIFKKYGYLDGDVWYDLLKQGVPLYVPIPSIATHMVKDWLAPGVNWEKLWKTLT